MTTRFSRLVQHLSMRERLALLLPKMPRLTGGFGLGTCCHGQD